VYSPDTGRMSLACDPVVEAGLRQNGREVLSNGSWAALLDDQPAALALQRSRSTRLSITGVGHVSDVERTTLSLPHT